MKFFEDLFLNYDFKNVGGLTDELKCVYISNYFKKENRNILVVCNSLYEANKFFQTITNYVKDTLFFPMDDFMTSEVLAVSPEFKMTRLETINVLRNTKPKIVVTNLMGYLRFLPPKKNFEKSYIRLSKGQNIDIKELTRSLYNNGYAKEVLVNKTGEMAIRGFVVDVFPINYIDPIRIEFWGDEIDSIRKFNVDNQLTIEELKEIEIIPNSEFLIGKDLEEELPYRKLIDYVPCVNIRNYMEDSVVFYNDIDDLTVSYKNLVNDMFEFCVSSNLPTDTKFMFELDKLNNEPIINLCRNDIMEDNKSINYTSYEVADKFIKFEEIQKLLEKYRIKYSAVIICVSNRYQANKIIDNIENDKIIFTSIDNIFPKSINIVVCNIKQGFIFKDYIVISEQEIFNRQDKYLSYKTNFKYSTRIKDITKLEIGDYIVHNIHGIGRYCGIKTISKNGLIKDYLQIEYRGGDKLYIPVEKIDMISKYSSSDGYEPRMNKLGTTEWEKVKLRARTKAKDIAKELLNLYALRELNEGFSFSKDDENQINFEKEFPYIETTDQLKVTEEIKKDMESPHPMDRLLCGDVGYGKTEVAFRACFKAILSGKQVALLCPTTILSNQHYQNALERFKSFPINIRLVNRFVSQKNLKTIISEIEQGKVDFVIGTHKLLNDSIKFKDLGLLIIDEEQRFGVKHKEKIKELKSNIDVLTLSATPIPRTLQMSLSGIRGLSTIETPPSNRYPVQTYVLGYNKKIVKDAIYKELSRHGQVFILYNRIDNMEEKMREIQSLSPDAKIIFAHGRMNKVELEDIMLKFINKEYDILICTTIIETGIDIPNVNTLIIIDADRFGLSQLYQLRGRVGRADKLAYCYLMYNQDKILNEVAKKRLNAIKEFTELGSGLSIAMRDLSIRGAGDILGDEQAGFVDSVGIELFMKMLKQEIDKLKGLIVEEEPDDSQPLVDVDTSVSDNYVSDEELKIEIHKKINEINSKDKLLEVKEELEDRFGRLSTQLEIYMYEEWFEHLANKLKIKKVNQNANYVEIVLGKEIANKINGEKLFLESLKINSNFKFKMQGGNLIISLNIKKLDKHFIFYLIDLLFVIETAI